MDKLEQHGTNSNKEKSNNQTVIQLAQRRRRRRRRIIIIIKRRRYTLFVKMDTQTNEQTNRLQTRRILVVLFGGFEQNRGQIQYSIKIFQSFGRKNVHFFSYVTRVCVRGSICRMSEGQKVQEQDKLARLPVSV